MGFCKTKVAAPAVLAGAAINVTNQPAWIVLLTLSKVMRLPLQ